jgi:hypothetical protein
MDHALRYECTCRGLCRGNGAWAHLRRAEFSREICDMTNQPEKRGRLIRHLEDALELADEIEDGNTGFLIERALDEARSRQFRPIG